MKQHTVRSFDEAMQRVTADLLRMGRIVQDELRTATSQLDNTAADDVQPMLDLEEWVDTLNERIDREVQQTLALRQPVAADLRALMSSNRIATEMERIGDHAKNMTRRAAIIAEQGVPMDFSRVRGLAEAVQAQLAAILTAIEQTDAEAAKIIWGKDAQIDGLYDEAFSTHLAEICQTPDNAVSCTHMLFIAKALERIGDHVTNMAEDLIYWVSAERLSKRATGGMASQS
ncbi:MAG: phosphate transport system regulatory protein PhoU [Chromatiaceae bacterium]|nr:MAG: phosphate transport system regulatory protein PhoU [Chromatiaceae bacterium]